MKRIHFEKLTSNDLLEYKKILTNSKREKNWNVLRTSILKKTQHPDLYPASFGDFIISDFSKLNEIYKDKCILDNKDIKLAKLIFNYSEYWMTKIAQFFIDKYDKLEITTCFYCDLNYVFPYVTKTSKVRMFDLDHFFENADSPLTAISLFNFIPSCQVCNSRIKHDKKFSDLYHLDGESDISDFKKVSPSSIDYDFDKKVQITVEDNTTGIGFFGETSKYDLLFETDDIDYKRVIAGFNLYERYNFPMIKKEALNLLECKRKFSKSRIQDIADFYTKNGIPTTPKEVDLLIFRMDDELEKKSVLGKLKHDILLYSK